MFFRLRVALLALGAVLGYGLAFHSMRHSDYRHRHEDFERHVAEICVGAANSLKASGPTNKAEPAAP
jgi:uncharacterized protein (DUF1501 family)